MDATDVVGVFPVCSDSSGGLNSPRGGLSRQSKGLQRGTPTKQGNTARGAGGRAIIVSFLVALPRIADVVVVAVSDMGE